MNSTIVKITSVCLINGAILASCTSGDSGSSASAIPADALKITASNAQDTMSAAVGTGTSLLTFAFGGEVVQLPSGMGFIDIIRDKTGNRSASALLDMPQGVSIPYNCGVSGTYTDNYTESNTSTGYSYSGTLAFEDCTEYNSVLGSTYTINGNASYNYSLNFSTDDYVSNFAGNATFASSGYVISISGLSSNITGNESTGDWNINTFNYTLDTNIGGGFAVKIESPLVGNDYNSTDCPLSGSVLASGAESTRARGLFNNDYTVTVSFDDGSGSFTTLSTSSCVNFI